MADDKNDRDRLTPEELRAQAEAIVEKRGAVQAVTGYLDDLRTERDRRRTAETELADLKKTAPKDGQVVLTKEDQVELEAFRALGKPDEVKGRLDKATELEQEKQQRDRADALAKATKAAGYGEDAPQTLTELKALDGAAFDVKEEKQGEETVTVPYVTLAGEGERPQKLDAFLEEKHPAIRRALMTEDSQGSTNGGPSYPSQRSGEERPKGKVTDEDLRRATEQTASYTL